MEKVIKFFTEAGIPLFLALAIAYVLFFPEKAQVLASILWSLVDRIFNFASKKVVSNQIEGHANNFARQIQRDLVGVKTRGVKIQWVKNEAREAFVEKGQIVIRLKHHRNSNKNMATIALLYIGEVIVPQAKKLLEEDRAEAIDLYMSRDFLHSEFPDALDQLHENYFLPASRKTKKYFSDFSTIDKHGLFIRVLIQELALLEKRFLFKGIDKKAREEVEQFIDFLKKIVERGRGEKVPLVFSGKFMKVGLILVAKPFKIELGIKPYIDRFEEKKGMGIEEIYLLAWDTQNMKFLEEILKSLRKNEDYYQKKVVKYNIEYPDVWFKKAKLAMFQKRKKEK